MPVLVGSSFSTNRILNLCHGSLYWAGTKWLPRDLRVIHKTCDTIGTISMFAPLSALHRTDVPRDHGDGDGTGLLNRIDNACQ